MVKAEFPLSSSMLQMSNGGKKIFFCEEKMRGRKKNYSTFKSKNNFDW